MKKLDTLTIISLAAMVWAIKMISHEIIGHGGAVLLFGGTPISVNAMFFEYDIPNATFWQQKFINANGSFINILLAVISVFWISKLHQPKSWKGYFLWLLMMVNFFGAGSYISFGRFINPGMDWAKILNDLKPEWLWETLVMSFGLILIGAGFYYGKKYLYLFLDSESSPRKRKLKILVLPLFTITTVAVLSALMMPTDDLFMMIMGAIGNGFTFLIGMLILALIPTQNKKITSIVPSLKRNYTLIIVSLVVTCLYLFVMSPGITF